MKKEHGKKDDRDMEGVDRRMSLTLSHRRKMIVAGETSINDVLLEYPWLGSVKELIKEFLRLGPNLGNREVMSTFYQNLSKYAPALDSLTKTRKAAVFAIDTKKRVKDLRVENDRKYVENCCAVLCLPCLFRENILDIVKTEAQYQTCSEPARVAICYESGILDAKKDSFKLVVEGVVVFKCNNFLKAILGLMRAISAFNLAYPKELDKTLLLLQKVFLGLDDESFLDKKLLHVMSQINQAL